METDSIPNKGTKAGRHQQQVGSGIVQKPSEITGISINDMYPRLEKESGLRLRLSQLELAHLNPV